MNQTVEQPPSRRSTPAAWLQLLRAPNLLTVPGDPIVGYFLVRSQVGGPVEAAPVALAAAAAVGLYAAGLITNDLFDLAEDRRDRPTRPLPAGEISLPAAWAAAAGLFLAALAAAFLARPAAGLWAAGLVGAILLYNGRVKRYPHAGPLLMGLCRGGSVLMGAAAAGFVGGRAVWAACMWTLFIAAVTNLAAGETRPDQPAALARFLPAIVLAACSAGFYALGLMNSRVETVTQAGSLAIQAMAAALAARYALMCRQAGDVPATVGRLIRLLLLLQVAMVMLGPDPGWIVGMCLLGLMPINALLARKFYAS